MTDEIEPLSYGEKELIKWQYRMQGDFKAALWNAICRADSSNLALLYMGFPEEVNAYHRFSQENGYWEDVLNRALKSGYLKEHSHGTGK